MSDIFCDQLLGLGFKVVFKFECIVECKLDWKLEVCCDGCLGNCLQGVCFVGKFGEGQCFVCDGDCCLQGKGCVFGGCLLQGGYGVLCICEDIDFVKVYVICVQKEKDDCIEVECFKQEEVCLCCEVKVKFDVLLEGKVFNVEVVDIVCYFLYGGKIKCIYVIVDQFKVFNVGEFGVLQQNGCYLLVILVVFDEVEVVFVLLVVLWVDFNVIVEEDLYVDLVYQVFDDLVW